MKKIALAFPGIGYHTDKPLLYYSKKLAAKHGYQTIDIPYTGFPSGVKGNAENLTFPLPFSMMQIIHWRQGM